MNEDSQLVQYIKQLENPSQEGYSVLTERWYRPSKKDFDSNQYGYGLDKNRNKQFKKFLSSINRSYITPDEESKYRMDYINGYLTDVWNNNTKNRQFSDKKKMMAYGLMYHGYGPVLWNKGNSIYDSFQNGSDEDMIKAVSDFYKGKNTERAKQHDNYWSNYKKPVNLLKPSWKKPQKYSFPIQFKKSGGGFTGAGAGGSWDSTSDTYSSVTNFNQAFDKAVKDGLREFIFQGRRYNTKKENNLVREFNNRWVGQGRKADIKNPSKEYDHQAGPLRTPLSLMPIVTDTYIGSPDRPPQLNYNPNGMEYFTSPFRSYPTARTARVTVPYHFNNKLTVKSK